MRAADRAAKGERRQDEIKIFSLSRRRGIGGRREIEIVCQAIKGYSLHSKLEQGEAVPAKERDTQSNPRRWRH